MSSFVPHRPRVQWRELKNLSKNMIVFISRNALASGFWFRFRTGG